ncbi:MAG: glutamine-hydrolyzing GMP synthase [Candidatus Melainabacteria bacterium]|nr:glutamine-hydrolyzing GMP synthase [Candidatus Melainabacteria bacterium]
MSQPSSFPDRASAVASLSAPATPVSQPAVETIAILDCGAQYTKVIDRRIRALKVATEIVPVTVDPETLRGQVSGIILSGGPHSVYDADAPRCHPGIFDLGVPVLGICYGMQLITQHFGGSVAGHQRREYGETTIQVDSQCPLFAGMDTDQQVLMSHGDSVTRLAEGFTRVAHSTATLPDGSPVPAAIEHAQRRVYGLQFHPEVELTEQGETMLANFLYKICGLTGNFLLDDRLERTLASIRQQVGASPVVVLVSGGVDSSVTAALLLRALGPDQVYAVHVDSGFMRQQESDDVCQALQALGLKHLKRLNAETDFLNASTTLDDGTVAGPLTTVTDPEAKRRIIGDVFFRLVETEMRQLFDTLAQDTQQPVFLAQGTLRPDLIESGNRDVSHTAHKIKTHHNDVPLIQAQRERGLVVEPNRDWHKDEVRQIGRLLGLPEPLVIRQPFPGPGLAIRVLCATEPYGLETYEQTNQQLQALVQQLSQAAGVSGYRALLVPVRTVGVQGDGRSYSYLALLSHKNLFEQAPDYRLLQHFAQEIPNQLNSINRIALVLNADTDPLPERLPAITPTHLTPPVVQQLRALDHQVTQTLVEANHHAHISQLLTVLVPISPNPASPTQALPASEPRHRSVAIRAVITSDFMTARPVRLGTAEMPYATLQTLCQRLTARPDVGWVMIDITGKPPATVEWE